MDRQKARRKQRKVLIALLLILCLIMNVSTACQFSSGLKRYEIQYFDVFDTVTTLIAYAEHEEEFKKQSEVIYSELKLYHMLYDIYHDYEGINNIKAINDNAGQKPITVDKKVTDLLTLAKEMYEKTDGKVNVAYGSVLSIWHKYRTEGLSDPDKARLPDKKELEEAAYFTDIDKIQINEAASTVYLQEKEMSLDVGAIGKGYAAQMAANAGKEAGMTSFLLNVGGNIVTEGTRGDGSPWTLGIQNPDTDSNEAYVLKVRLNGDTLVTSGNYQRFYEVNGKKYHHIINPDTGMPADYFASVSIITKDSGIADALSTAIYNMPLEQGMELVESMENTEAVWILEDGKKFYTSGFKKYLIE